MSPHLNPPSTEWSNLISVLCLAIFFIWIRSSWRTASSPSLKHPYFVNTQVFDPTGSYGITYIFFPLCESHSNVTAKRPNFAGRREKVNGRRRRSLKQTPPSGQLPASHHRLALPTASSSRCHDNHHHPRLHHRSETHECCHDGEFKGWENKNGKKGKKQKGAKMQEVVGAGLIWCSATFQKKKGPLRDLERRCFKSVRLPQLPQCSSVTPLTKPFVPGARHGGCVCVGGGVLDSTRWQKVSVMRSRSDLFCERPFRAESWPQMSHEGHWEKWKDLHSPAAVALHPLLKIIVVFKWWIHRDYIWLFAKKKKEMYLWCMSCWRLFFNEKQI